MVETRQGISEELISGVLRRRSSEDLVSPLPVSSRTTGVMLPKSPTEPRAERVWHEPRYTIL